MPPQTRLPNPPSRYNVVFNAGFARKLDRTQPASQCSDGKPAISANPEQNDRSQAPKPYDLNADNPREPEAYELADPDAATPPREGSASDVTPPNAPPEAAPPEAAAPDAAPSDTDADDVYELAEPDDDVPTGSAGLDLAADPRAAGAVDDDSDDSPAPTSAAGPSASARPSGGPPDRAVPAIHSTEEPKYVDPTVAARRREEARARAAEQMAIDHARRVRRNLILAAAALVAALIIALILWL